MAWYAKYRATLIGRAETWTIDIENDTGADPGVTTIDVDPDVSITWGNPTDPGRGGQILASYSRMKVFDPDGVVFADLDGADEDVWRAKIYSGSYAWYGHPRMTSINRFLSTTTQEPVIDLYFYDRLTLLQESGDVPVAANDTITGFTSIHQWFKTWLYDTCQELDIVYVMGWLPSNINATGVTIAQVGLSQNYIDERRDGRRLEGGTFYGGTRGGQRGSIIPATSGRSVIRSDGYARGRPLAGGATGVVSGTLSALEDLAAAFDLRIWQDFTGDWIVAQRNAIGEAVGTSKRCVSLWDGATVATSSTTASSVAITDNDLNRDTEAISVPAPAKVIVNRSLPNVKWANVVKDGTFEDSPDLTSTDNAYWSGTNSPVLDTSSANAWGGNNSVRLDAAVGAEESIISNAELLHVDSESGLGAGVRFECNFKNNEGSPTDVEVFVQISVNPPTGTVNYWDGTAWQAGTPSSVTITRNVEATTESGYETQDWETNIELMTDPFPIDGRLALKIAADGTGGAPSTQVWIDQVELILHDNGQPITGWSSVWDGNGSNGDVSYSRPFANVSNYKMLVETAGSTWKQIVKWVPQEAYTGIAYDVDDEYGDLAWLQAAEYNAQHDGAIKSIVGEYMGLLTPSDEITYGGNTYLIGEGCEYRLKDAVTKFSMIEKKRFWST